MKVNLDAHCFLLKYPLDQSASVHHRCSKNEVGYVGKEESFFGAPPRIMCGDCGYELEPDTLARMAFYAQAMKLRLH